MAYQQKGFILDKIGKPNANLYKKNVVKRDCGCDGKYKAFKPSIYDNNFGLENFNWNIKPYKFNNNLCDFKPINCGSCNVKPIQCGGCWDQPNVVYYKKPEKVYQKQWVPSRGKCCTGY